MEEWVIGIDLGATKIALGLLDPENQLVATSRLPTLPEDGSAALVERIAGGVDALTAKVHGGGRIAALGICTPGPVDHRSGTLLDPPNMRGLHNTPLRDLLTARLRMPVVVEHDAKAAALGEHGYGAGQGEQSMAYVVVGTGVGAAFILDGRLYRGLRNSAGEVGGMTLDRDAEERPTLCGANIRGCAQGYMSGPAISFHYERLARAAGRPDVQPIEASEVSRRAAEGDALAQEVMHEAGSALGIMIASMAQVLDIELYIVGGSVVKSEDLLLAPARATVGDYTFDSIGAHIRIVPAALGEIAPILGCGGLAREALASLT